MRRILRTESFGIIVQPPLTKSLVYLTRKGARPARPLKAPVEAHLSITSACANRCPHCYESSSPRGTNLGLEYWRGVIDTLSSMGVFHCAIGGGEPATVPWLFDLAAHARKRGLIPNLTTSGAGVTDAWARRSEIFGQVNVSIDGPDGPRGREALGQAVRAAEILRRRRDDVGANCVVTRGTFAHLADLCALARRLRLSEIEFLRFKPAEKAARHRSSPAGARPPVASFEDADLTPAMYAAIVPTVRRLMLRYRTKIKLDCSMVPAVASAGVRPGVMEFLGAAGCEGGNELGAVDAKGFVHGCSFDRRRECRAGDLQLHWPRETAFVRFRRWEQRGARVCLDCDWFDVCRGGCHVVARHVTGSWYAPDPSCAIASRRLS